MQELFISTGPGSIGLVIIFVHSKKVASTARTFLVNSLSIYFIRIPTSTIKNSLSRPQLKRKTTRKIKEINLNIEVEYYIMKNDFKFCYCTATIILQ